MSVAIVLMVWIFFFINRIWQREQLPSRRVRAVVRRMDGGTGSKGRDGDCDQILRTVEIAPRYGSYDPEQLWRRREQESTRLPRSKLEEAENVVY